MKNKIIHKTAVFNGKNFEHFGIRPITASVYGNKVSDIVEVELSIADNQDIPPSPQDDPKINEPDYWGWWDNEKQDFTMIYAKRFLLDMCFPVGIEATEKHYKGKTWEGKAYRLNVIFKK